MQAPIKELEAIKGLLETARRHLEEGDWDAAEKAVRDALALDENHVPTCAAMTDVFEARGNPAEAGQWRAKAEQVRLRAWQRQVEAEARGHHDMLGEPSRKEIP